MLRLVLFATIASLATACQVQQDGEAIAAIAKRCGDVLPSELLFANPELKTPKDIKAGMNLKAPATKVKRLPQLRTSAEQWCDAAAIYKVPTGQTCFDICKKFEVTLDTLTMFNPGFNHTCGSGNVPLREAPSDPELEICIHKVQKNERAMAQFMLNANSQIGNTYEAYLAQPQDPTHRFRFWKQLKETILSRRGTTFLGQVVSHNLEGYAEYERRQEQDNNRTGMCEQFSRMGPEFPKDITECTCDSTRCFTECMMRYQDFVEKQPTTREVSTKPAPFDYKPNDWPSTNNTFRSGVQPQVGMSAMCSDMFFQHGSFGRGCVRGGCKFTLSTPMDPIQKAIAVHGGICTTNNFKTIGKSLDIAGHEQLANLNAFVAIEYCMQLRPDFFPYQKMVPDWVRNALNYDLFCIGTDLKLYMFQSTQRESIYINLFFLRFVVFVKHQITVEQDIDQSNNLCTGYGGERPDIKAHFECSDFCQMRAQGQKGFGGFQFNVVALWFSYTIYEKQWGLGPCIKSNALPAIPDSNFEPGNNMCFMLDKAPRGKNGEKKSEEQLVLDGDTTREEICNGIKGCKKFKPEMKGCGSCEFCLPRAAFEVRNSLIDINWEDPGAPKEQVLMKEDLNFFDYDNWIDVRKRVKGADSSYNLTLQPITHSYTRADGYVPLTFGDQKFHTEAEKTTFYFASNPWGNTIERSEDFDVDFKVMSPRQCKTAVEFRAMTAPVKGKLFSRWTMTPMDDSIATESQMTNLMQENGFAARVESWHEKERKMVVVSEGTASGRGTTGIKLALECLSRWGNGCPKNYMQTVWRTPQGEVEIRVPFNKGQEGCNPCYYERMITLVQPKFATKQSSKKA